jgi:hypothetical protein
MNTLLASEETRTYLGIQGYSGIENNERQDLNKPLVHFVRIRAGKTSGQVKKERFASTEQDESNQSKTSCNF